MTTMKNLDELLDTLPGYFMAVVTSSGHTESEFRLNLNLQAQMRAVAAETLAKNAIGGTMFEAGHREENGLPVAYVAASSYMFTREQLGKLLAHIYMEGARSSWPLSIPANGTPH